MSEQTTIPFQGGELIVTSRAIDSLLERWPNPRFRPKRPLKTIQNLLAQAKLEEATSAARVRRLIDHDFVPTEFWVSTGWRFVIAVGEDGQRKLVSAEWIVR